jgi:hypothetical protein
MTDLARLTIAELADALRPSEYYTPEHNPLGSKRDWARMCRDGLFPCAKIGKRWIARRADFDRWFDAQTQRPEEDPIESLARSAGVKARRCA